MLVGAVIAFIAFVGHGVFDHAYKASVDEYQETLKGN